MKKKIVAVSVIIAILAIAIVGGSLAWFTDDDAVKNTFTIGKIDIFQHEHEHNENNEIQQFTQDQVLLPIVNTDAPAEDANYIEKLVSVENIGVNDAYVRTFIAVPAAIREILVLDTVDPTGETYWTADTTAWQNVTVDGVEYAVVSFTYNKKLAKGEVTDHVLKGVYLKPEVDVQKNSEGVRQFCTKNADGTYTFYDYDITGQVNVLVATQGCQADGFENGAADAVNTAFGNTAPDFAAVSSGE